MLYINCCAPFGQSPACKSEFPLKGFLPSIYRFSPSLFLVSRGEFSRSSLRGRSERPVFASLCITLIRDPVLQFATLSLARVTAWLCLPLLCPPLLCPLLSPRAALAVATGACSRCARRCILVLRSELPTTLRSVSGKCRLFSPSAALAVATGARSHSLPLRASLHSRTAFRVQSSSRLWLLLRSVACDGNTGKPECGRTRSAAVCPR